jgi:hypothetical protein
MHSEYIVTDPASMAIEWEMAWAGVSLQSPDRRSQNGDPVSEENQFPLAFRLAPDSLKREGITDRFRDYPHERHLLLKRALELGRYYQYSSDKTHGSSAPRPPAENSSERTPVPELTSAGAAAGYAPLPGSRRRLERVAARRRGRGRGAPSGTADEGCSRRRKEVLRT